MISFSPAEIIQKKRDGKALSSEEMRFFVEGLNNGNVADYQASAFLMAVFFRGMNLQETVELTRLMVDSGEKLDLSGVSGPKVDKHSTGGVGDKVSLILAPLAAACGLKVPMMAGRGLGNSGGTIDKLESIPGYSTQVEPKKIVDQLKRIGVVLVGQSDKIARADKKLYAIRDVTATIDSIPLITASILSKKIAEGTQGLLLDVKIGNGAFMRTKAQARALAASITKVAKAMGVRCQALLSDMNQPLGYAVGNSLEVIESIEVLKNQSCLLENGVSSDLKELTIQSCAHMLMLGGLSRSLSEARKLAHQKLADGSAYRVFEQLVEAQGGSLDYIRNPLKLPLAPIRHEWKAPRRGFIKTIDTNAIGHLLVELGGGRKRAEDSIDPGVGFLFHKKLGSPIRAGETIVTAYVRSEAQAKMADLAFEKAMVFGSTRKPVPRLIHPPSSTQITVQ